MNIFFTSDSHYGHGNIIKYSKRPFLSPEDKNKLSNIGVWNTDSWIKDNALNESASEAFNKFRLSDESVYMMDDALINETNAVVGENDVLWHLGDFAFAGKYDYYAKCRSYRDRIKCKNVNLVWGNHDNRIIRDLFGETYDLKMIRVPNQRTNIVLCHYAMAVYDGSHKGNLHLYGHSHSEAEPWLDHMMPGRKSLDVGVDNAAKLFGKYRPISLTEIQERLIPRVGFSFDHHANKSSNRAMIP